MSSDPLTDVLNLTNAQAIVAGGFRAGGTWAVRFPPRDLIRLTAITRGSCWFWLDGEPEPVRLEAGDAGLITVNQSSVMASAPGLEPIDAAALFSQTATPMAVVGDGADFSFLGGHIALNPSNGALLADVLPPWLLIKAGSAEAETFRWLLNQLVVEGGTGQPGGPLASGYLGQLLFIQILRAHLNTGAALPAGWLRALADAKAAPALKLMHGDPGRNWGLEELAKACAMSRTSFAGHFKAVAGKAPLTYLTDWRMRLAERALREETTAVAVIGQALGYSSESAFSNAFKRVTGRSPKGFRSAFRNAAAPA